MTSRRLQMKRINGKNTEKEDFHKAGMIQPSSETSNPENLQDHQAQQHLATKDSKRNPGIHQTRINYPDNNYLQYQRQRHRKNPILIASQRNLRPRKIRTLDESQLQKKEDKALRTNLNGKDKCCTTPDITT